MIGRRLSHFEITDRLGEGGMGEVYLAEDTRLGRQVAIKVLLPQFASDPSRLSRFELEARSAAALNHPHIAAVLDVGEEPGEEGEAPVHYIVEEYLEGQTLREALARPLPLKQALTFAVELAEALKAAHDAGIVHRDLKPENVFVTTEEHIKILDFGLAKLTEEVGGITQGKTDSPTATMAGKLMGTVGYISPEQVQGEEVDHRADLFAFGCVLDEMATGRKAFGGDNVHDTLSRILSGQREPADERLPAKLQWILDKALATDPRERYQTAGDLIVDLRGIEVEAGAGATAAHSAEEAGRRGPSWAMAAVGGLLLLLLGIAVPFQWRSTSTPPPRHVLLEFGLTDRFTGVYNRALAVSPDGQTVACSVVGGMLLRRLDGETARVVPESETARAPFFSPDSRQLGFWSGGRVKRVSVDGGVPVDVATMGSRPFGAYWGDDGFIYVGLGPGGIWRYPATGGPGEQVAEVEPGELADGPHLLPGGEWLLFSVAPTIGVWDEADIVAHSLKSGERQVLIEGGREPRYARSGHLLYVRNQVLFAVRFDPGSLEVVGGAVSMADGLRVSENDETGAAFYDLAHDGTLVYATSGAGELRVAWIGLDGEVEPLPFPPRRYHMAAASPDDLRIAFEADSAEGRHIWVHRTEQGVGQRLTIEGHNRLPVWSKDGEWIYFASDRNGDYDIWRRRADGVGTAEIVLDLDGNQSPSAIAPDGSWLLFREMSPSNDDIMRLFLTGERAGEVVPEIAGPADELWTSISPDGRYATFQSDETGRWDVHVLELGTGRRWVASSSAGHSPRWSRDGSRIFYRATALMYAVRVTTDPEFRILEPEHLVEAGRGISFEFDTSADGSRLLALQPDVADRDREQRVVVELNWFEKLRAQLP